MVAYVDGGCRPTNPGPGGWGVHGYIHSGPLDGKAVKAGDYVPTSVGYVSAKDATLIAKSVVVAPTHFVDAYGSFNVPVSNNVAELAAATNALEYAARYNINRVQLYTDSQYVCRGLEGLAENWRKNNWMKADNTPPKNVDHWKKLLTARDVLNNRGVATNVSWVKGHSDKIEGMTDILGNIKADRLATAGVMGSKQGQLISSITTTEADGYWKYDVERHPMINHRRMYFNTTSEHNQPGIYFLGDHGKDDDMLGKRVSDGAFSVVELKQPDMILEMVRNHQIKLAEDIDTIVMVRLDKLYRPDTHRELTEFGTHGLEQENMYRLDLSCLDREPLTRELRPAKLAMRAIISLSDLIVKLREYKEKSPNLIVTDLTDILYETTTKVSKKDVITKTTKFKAEYGVGFASLHVNANYQSDIGLKNATITMTLGIDMLDRNALKRLEETSPKVSLITWLESPDVFRYATIVESGEDIGIWCGVYSNIRFVKPL
jgi:ribonuclease HI